VIKVEPRFSLIGSVCQKLIPFAWPPRPVLVDQRTAVTPTLSFADPRMTIVSAVVLKLEPAG
jgi:hypothetical protein